MTTSTAKPALEGDLGSQDALHVPTGPIIVATDGRADAEGAVGAAALFAERTGAAVRVVAVLEPLLIPAPESDFTPVVAGVYEARPRALRAAVEAQVRRCAPAGADWPITVVTGDPAPTLARMAHDADARLLLVGRGRHSMLARLVMGETVMRILQLADVPVLAAEPDLEALPQRVLIAMDFSPFSVYAARIAVALAEPHATFYIAHVVPAAGQAVPAGAPPMPASDADRERAFERVRQTLGAEAMNIELVTLHGDPGEALVDFAGRTQVDLVASGTHGYGFFNRLILGSVARQLLRGARCSVLAVPGSAVTRAATRAQAMPPDRTRTVPPPAWSAEVADFSRRNSGRLCTLEFDDREFGAQHEEVARPLVGAVFERRSQTMELMFGASRRAGPHVTHVVPRVTELELLTDPDGRDRSLRLGHPAGQTLLIFND